MVMNQKRTSGLPRQKTSLEFGLGTNDQQSLDALRKATGQARVWLVVKPPTALRLHHRKENYACMCVCLYACMCNKELHLQKPEYQTFCAECSISGVPTPQGSSKRKLRIYRGRKQSRGISDPSPAAESPGTAVLEVSGPLYALQTNVTQGPGFYRCRICDTPRHFSHHT